MRRALQANSKIVGALTTVNDAFHRVSIHGVREDLLRSQVDAAGLRTVIVHIPYPGSDVVYERKKAEAMAAARTSGVTHMIFGDLFLEDVRAYRERQLSGTGTAPGVAPVSRCHSADGRGYCPLGARAFVPGVTVP